MRVSVTAPKRWRKRSLSTPPSTTLSISGSTLSSAVIETLSVPSCTTSSFPGIARAMPV
jgi:hypothetical protein